jgi:hypothetical protein
MREPSDATKRMAKIMGAKFIMDNQQPTQELQEIADGAYGDGPRTRGLARDALAQMDNQQPTLREAAQRAIDALRWINGPQSPIAADLERALATLTDEAAVERAAIVAWMREDDGWAGAQTVRAYADQIEKGEHHRAALAAVYEEAK